MMALRSRSQWLMLGSVFLFSATSSLVPAVTLARDVQQPNIEINLDVIQPQPAPLATQPAVPAPIHQNSIPFSVGSSVAPLSPAERAVVPTAPKPVKPARPKIAKPKVQKAESVSKAEKKDVEPASAPVASSTAKKAESMVVSQENKPLVEKTSQPAPIVAPAITTPVVSAVTAPAAPHISSIAPVPPEAPTPPALPSPVSPPVSAVASPSVEAPKAMPADASTAPSPATPLSELPATTMPEAPQTAPTEEKAVKMQPVPAPHTPPAPLAEDGGKKAEMITVPDKPTPKGLEGAFGEFLGETKKPEPEIPAPQAAPVAPVPPALPLPGDDHDAPAAASPMPALPVGQSTAPVAAPVTPTAAESAAAQHTDAAITSDLRITYNETETDVPLSIKAELDGIVKKYTEQKASRIVIYAYASGAETSGIYPKRVSLARGIAVRNYLTTEKGIDIERVNVKALGNKNAGGPADRVDVVIEKN